MEAELTGHCREWSGLKVCSFVNYWHDKNNQWDRKGVLLTIEPDNHTKANMGRVHIGLHDNEARLLAHRLLRAIGDRV